jgi:tetratricopeptide (TPR) repeat protein
MRPRYLICFLFAAAALSAQPVAPPEGRRVALVIGNDAYAAGALKNAVNDARAMQKALTGAGFQVILAENANKVAMEHQIAEFLQSIGPSDTALFYFAGHAVQVENENLLLPVDFAPGRSIIEAKFRAVSLAMILDYLKRTRPKTTIIILDACRNNPAAEVHSLQAGLAIPLNAGRETYIAFSTSPNHVASDNPDGLNSWFTEALAAQIQTPGLSIDEVFTRVRLRVESATGGAQTPWSQTSLTARFYFHPPASGDSETVSGMAEKWWQDALQLKQQADWAGAIDLASRVVKARPGRTLEERAQALVAALETRQDAARSFQRGDYAAAVSRFKNYLGLDPFDMDAAVEAAGAALLAEDLETAASFLQTIRARGASPDALRAEAMLKELAGVSTAAAQALSTAPPAPPPIESLFPGHRFGVPDFAAAYPLTMRPSAVDFAALARLTAAVAPGSLAAASPSQPQPADAATATSPDAPRIEVRQLDADAARDLFFGSPGELAFTSSRQQSVVLFINGQPVAQKLPFSIRLRPGQYEIRLVGAGQVLTERQVRLQSGQRTELEVEW